MNKQLSVWCCALLCMGYIGNAGVTTPFLDLLSYPLVVEERSLGMHWHEMSREGAGVQLIHCTMFYWCLDPGETTTFQVSGRCLMAPQALMTTTLLRATQIPKLYVSRQLPKAQLSAAEDRSATTTAPSREQSLSKCNREQERQRTLST